MEELKDELIEFVKKNFSDYDIERENGPEYFGEDINTIIENNTKIIKNMKDDGLIFLKSLMEEIKKGHLNNMDKECMVPFSTSGFVFHGGKLIIFNER